MTINYRIKTFLKEIFLSFFISKKEKDKTENSKTINNKYLCKKDYYLPKHVPKILYSSTQRLNEYELYGFWFNVLLIIKDKYKYKNIYSFFYLKLIEYKKIPRKLLTPNLENIYNIKIEEKIPVIKASTVDDFYLDLTIDQIDVQIQIYLIHFVIHMLNLTKKYSNKFKLNLKIFFDTEKFSNATRRIALKHDQYTEQVEIIQAILVFIHEVDDMYDITFLKKIQIKTFYEPIKK